MDRKNNGLGIAGFVLSSLSLIIIASIIIEVFCVHPETADNQFGNAMFLILFIMPTGLAMGVGSFGISLIGLILGLVRKYRLNGFAIAGIVISLAVVAMIAERFFALGLRI